MGSGLYPQGRRKQIPIRWLRVALLDSDCADPVYAIISHRDLLVILGTRCWASLWAGVLFLSFLVPGTQANPDGSERSLMEAWNAAKQLGARGRTIEAIEAYGLMKERAVRGGDDYWAFYAARNQAWCLNALGRTRDGEASARAALGHVQTVLDRGDSRMARHVALAEKAVVLGYIEKSLAEQGRIASGRTMHNRVVDAIAEMMSAMGAPRDRDFAGKAMARVDNDYRHLLLRAVWREAEYLDFQGDTVAAVALLRRADESAHGLGLTETADLNYWFKIRHELARKLRFLGYRREAMDLLRAVIREAGALGQSRAQCFARLGLAGHLSWYYGPSVEYLEEALSAWRDLGRASVGQVDYDGELLIAQMIHDLRGERSAVGQLDAVLGKFRELGRDFDAQYAERDRLVILRQRGEYAGLEQGFIRLLEDTRARGIKRAEPTLYREYACLLADLGRHREAAQMQRQAVTLSRAFGWHLHLPNLLMTFADYLYSMGDMAGMEAAWAEIDQLMAARSDMPPEHVLEVMVGRMKLLRRRGDETAIRAVFARATEFAKASGIPDYLAQGLRQFPLDGAVEVKPAGQAEQAMVDLQPIVMSTHVQEGESARGRFTVSNPGDRGISGRLAVRGPDAALSNLPEVRALRVALGNGPEPDREVTRDISLGAGEQVVVYLDVQAVTAHKLKAAVGWRPAAGGEAQTGEWSCTGDGSEAQVAVVNANLARDNPFYSVPLYHEIYHRGAGGGIEDFRIRVSASAHVEFVEEGSGRILAVDRGGDGAFDGEGDVVTADANRNGFPDIQFDGSKDVAAVELRVYCLAAEPAAYGEEGISLFFEVRSESGWVVLAEDRLLAPVGRH